MVGCLGRSRSFQRLEASAIRLVDEFLFTCLFQERDQGLKSNEVARLAHVDAVTIWIANLWRTRQHYIFFGLSRATA